MYLWQAKRHRMADILTSGVAIDRHVLDNDLVQNRPAFDHVYTSRNVRPKPTR